MDNHNNRVKPLSAIAKQMVPGHYGLADKTGVIAGEIDAFHLVQFAAWPETLAQVADRAAKLIGSDQVPGPGRFVQTGQGLLLRVEPLKFWLLTNSQDGPESLILEPDIGCTLDLSHSRTGLRIRGQAAATLLNHFLPIDFRPASLVPGAVISTAFHHVGITLLHRDGEFELILPRSFALSLWEMLHESALQYGLEIIASDTLNL